MPSRSVLTNVGHAVRSARTNPLPRSSTIASDRSTLSIGTLRGRSGRCLARACWGYRYFVPTGHLAPPPALASQLWGAPAAAAADDRGRRRGVGSVDGGAALAAGAGGRG